MYTTVIEFGVDLHRIIDMYREQYDGGQSAFNANKFVSLKQAILLRRGTTPSFFFANEREAEYICVPHIFASENITFIQISHRRN